MVWSPATLSRVVQYLCLSRIDGTELVRTTGEFFSPGLRETMSQERINDTDLVTAE